MDGWLTVVNQHKGCGINAFVAATDTVDELVQLAGPEAAEGQHEVQVRHSGRLRRRRRGDDGHGRDGVGKRRHGECGRLSVP